MGAWRDAVDKADGDVSDDACLETAGFRIAFALSLGYGFQDARADQVLCAAAILRRAYRADGMDDPGRSEPYGGLAGDERLWRALCRVAGMQLWARADAWDGLQKAYALRDAEAELRQWWKEQR
jgi:hypothetical protein